MSRLPAIKKTVQAFLAREDGKISKKTLLSAGLIAASIAASSATALYTPDCPGVVAPDNGQAHENSLGITDTAQKVMAVHNHCMESHVSHASGGGCCFPSGTTVLTPDGDRPIEKLVKGDMVLAYDLKEGKVKEDTVVGVISPARLGLYNINAGLVRVTGDHPFYAKKSGKLGWAAINREEAANSDAYHDIEGLMKLEVGDSIFSRQAKWIKVKKIDYEEDEAKTYTIKVAKFKNFFANNLLVHNPGCGGPCSW
jgi:hypothetical protein